MIGKVWSLKSQMKTLSFLEKVITPIGKLFKYFEYGIEVQIPKMGNLN